MNPKQKRMLLRIVAAFLCMILLAVLPVPNQYGKAALYLVAYLIIGYDILRKAVLGIVHGEVFDENFLMAVATIGAICLGDFREGVAVMLFYQIGELFQSYAVGRSRKNIAALMDICPDYANLERDGQIEQVDPDEVAEGSILIVRPGEKIPIDGVVVEGTSVLNTSALTGESIPREVGVSDEVISGCVNLSGMLKIRTTKAFEDSTVSKILELVEESSMRKSKSEQFITKFARYYTPAVCYGALALALLPPFVLFCMGQPAAMGVWVKRALTFLVISCPCALVISIPLSFFGGIGGASARGILIKGANYLETLAKTRYLVCDKTGTLTRGVFEVVQIHPVEGTKEELLTWAALAECYSNHPVSRSLKEAYGQKIDTDRVSQVQEISGKGITARVDGKEVAVGNKKLMGMYGIAPEESDLPGTSIYVAVEGAYKGSLLIADTVKPTAKAAVAELKKAGIQKVIMLTGDGKKTAEAVAAELGVDEVHCELLPEDKVRLTEELLSSRKPKEQLAFVGDGINDAPVLSRADIGIAMGAMGSDAAIEAADVVLMDDDPAKIALAMKISRKTLGIVYQNIIGALLVKGVCLILGAIGLAGMWAAIFADVGVMVLAVLNATRALQTRSL